MRHIGKVNFVLLFGIIISIPLLINYYLFKILISLLSFSFFSWEYSLTELVLVTITCVLLGILFGIYVQSKRMVVVTLEKEDNGISFMKITFHDKRLLKNTDKVEISWDTEQESIQTFNKRSKLIIPYNSENLNVIKSPQRVNFIDINGESLYEAKIV